MAAFSYPVAAHIGKRFGLVNTMVFTHIPASICLILVAFCWNLPLAIFLLLVRAALSQMDVPTRTSYVMAIVTPPERTIAASFTAVPRSLASSDQSSIGGGNDGHIFHWTSAHHFRMPENLSTTSRCCFLSATSSRPRRRKEMNRRSVQEVTNNRTRPKSDERDRSRLFLPACAAAASTPESIACQRCQGDRFVQEI